MNDYGSLILYQIKARNTIKANTIAKTKIYRTLNSIYIHSRHSFHSLGISGAIYKGVQHLFIKMNYLLVYTQRRFCVFYLHLKDIRASTNPLPGVRCSFWMSLAAPVRFLFFECFNSIFSTFVMCICVHLYLCISVCLLVLAAASAFAVYLYIYSNTPLHTRKKNICIFYNFYSFLLQQVYAELLILRMKPLAGSLWFSFVFAWFAFEITFLKIN